MPVETCQKYTGTLSEILALTPVVQTIADATDVPGVRLEWMNGAWYGNCGFPSAAQHSALLAANAYNSLAIGGVTATVSGVQYTWQGAAVGWVGARAFTGIPSGPVARLGDSIVHITGNSIDVALSSLGFPAPSGDYGIGGSRINQQFAQVDAIASAGYRSVFVEVGTNDVGQGRTAAQMLADYRALFGLIKSKGLDCRVIYIPPVGTASSAKSSAVMFANIAAYKAASENGFPCYEIYAEFSSQAGGFISSAYTCGGDGVHPVLSKRVQAGSRLATKILGGFSDPPVARDSFCTILGGNGMFKNPTNGLGANWSQQLSSGVTATNSVSEFGDSGSGVNTQTVSLSGGFPANGSGSTYSNLFSGFSVGDKVALFGVLKVTDNLDEASGVDDTAHIGLMLNCVNGGVEYKVGDFSFGDGRFYGEYVVPAGTTYLMSKMQVYGITHATTGVVTFKARGIGLVNLTTAGLV